VVVRWTGIGTVVADGEGVLVRVAEGGWRNGGGGRGLLT